MQANGYQKVAAGLAALPLAFSLGAADANALSSADVRSLTYQQIKGTGLANRCPEVEVNGDSIELQKGTKYKITDLCLEPKSFQIEEEIVKKRTGETKKGEFLFQLAFVDCFRLPVAPDQSTANRSSLLLRKACARARA